METILRQAVQLLGRVHVYYGLSQKEARYTLNPKQDGW